MFLFNLKTLKVMIIRIGLMELIKKETYHALKSFITLKSFTWGLYKVELHCFCLKSSLL